MKTQNSIQLNTVVAALKSGFRPSQIAESIGVTESAVSQYIEEHKLEAVAAPESKFASIDAKLNTLEERVLDRLDLATRMLPTSNPLMLVKLYRELNQAKRRSLAEGQAIVNYTDVRLVSLNLPQRAAVDAKLNAQNEVIEVNGRELTTIPSGKLKDLQKQLQARTAEGAKNFLEAPASPVTSGKVED